MQNNFLFGSIPQTSGAGSFDSNDFKRSLRHFAVVAAGAALVAVISGVAQVLGSGDFGKYQWVVGIVISSGLLESARAWVSSHLQ